MYIDAQVQGMVVRDPNTGQFQAGDDERGPEDPYINTTTLFYTNTWGEEGGAHDHNFDEIDGRNSLKTVDIERPDDHLVEIHGVDIQVSDFTEDGKVMVWVANDVEPQPGGFSPAMRNYDDTLIAQYAAGTDVDGKASDQAQMWLPKPMLSTGKIAVHKRSGTTDVGEIGATLYYTYREFDENEVLQQLIQTR